MDILYDSAKDSDVLFSASSLRPSTIQEKPGLLQLKRPNQPRLETLQNCRSSHRLGIQTARAEHLTFDAAVVLGGALNKGPATAAGKDRTHGAALDRSMLQGRDGPRLQHR